MTYQPYHFGLYFTPEHVKIAQAGREAPPFDAAWTLLHERELGGVQEAQWGGLRYRFDNDAEAGAKGVKCLIECLGDGFDEQMTYIDAVNEACVEAHAFEMLRDHPAFSAEQQAHALELFAQEVRYLNELDYQRSYVEALTLTRLNFIAGIVYDDVATVHAGIGAYERVVREDIHPQGYMPKGVEARDGGGLLRQILAVQSLVLMAESARHIGFDLWGYSFRGVSVMTAFSYLPYYYFFPDKWRWDTTITNEPFGEYGGFLEIVNRHADPKDLKPLLNDLRPIYDGPGGGLTTLSHGVAVKSGRRGR